MATLNGCRPGLKSTSNGQRKSFHEATTVKIATTASAGRDSGSMMRVKSCQPFAPSRRAASVNSVGTVSKKLFRIRMFKALAASGSQTPAQLLISDTWIKGRLLMFTNWGIKYTTGGTIKVEKKT